MGGANARRRPRRALLTPDEDTMVVCNNYIQPIQCEVSTGAHDQSLLLAVRACYHVYGEPSGSVPRWKRPFEPAVRVLARRSKAIFR